MSRLRPLTLADFTGGLNARRSQFTLADNESPSMVNMEVDPRLGIHTRRGWERWNAADIVDISVDTWDPRLAKLHPLSTGGYQVYVTNREAPTTGAIWAAGSDGVFSQLTDGVIDVACSADPHMADFALWGDEIYIACGTSNVAHVRDGTADADSLTDAATNYSDDYANPSATPSFPKADFVETHAGYVFAASVNDTTGVEPNRIRWSHPNKPDAWATLDFLDIKRGGARITGLLSFRDHLLIFKTDSMWALYGYDIDTWQLVEVSSKIGCPTPTAFTRSESAVFFFSATNRNGIYAYSGGAPVYLSERIEPIVEGVTDFENVFFGWVGRRLWCSLPVGFTYLQDGVSTTFQSSVMVFDPTIGDGAWVRHTPAMGTMGPIVEFSDISTNKPMAVLNDDSGAAAVVQLEFRDDAYDVILTDYTTYLGDGADFIGDGGDQIIDNLGGVPAGDPLLAAYRTGWKNAGEEERRKSWLRPRYIHRVPTQTVRVRADVYWDYNETRVRRTTVGELAPDGQVFWTTLGSASTDPPGADWGDGSTWGGSLSGGALERIPGNLGVCSAVQIEILSDPSTPGVAFGIDAIHLKYVLRRYTT